MPYKDPKKLEQYYQVNKERLRRAARVRYKRNEERIKKQRKIWQLENPEKVREYANRWTKKLRVQVIAHYGNGKIACVRCGEEGLPCLSIDHINGNGNKHRRKMEWTRGGTSFYLWLKRNNYPAGYQTLCMNCQFKKRDENKEY